MFFERCDFKHNWMEDEALADEDSRYTGNTNKPALKGGKIAITDLCGDCRYFVKYHLIWRPKLKASDIYGPAQSALREILLALCSKYRYEVHSLEVHPTYIHILLSADPSVAPGDVARTLKSLSAVSLFQQFPALRSFYGRQGSLWDRRYLISTGEIMDAIMLSEFLKNDLDY
jgi:putative transposase